MENLCQALLKEVNSLPTQSALNRIERFNQEHTFEAKRDSGLWVLLQEIRFQEGRLALELGHHSRCVRSLEQCEWQEAKPLIKQAVIEAWPEASLGLYSQVIRLRAGDYHVYSRDYVDGRYGDMVTVGRLSSTLEPRLHVRMPSEAHDELLALRDFKFTQSKIAQAMAKSAFLLHHAGQSELALGILEAALAAGLEHPSFLPSRNALLAKGIQAAPEAEGWLETYKEDEFCVHTTPRVDFQQARQDRLAETKSFIKRGFPNANQHTKAWIAQASLAELEEVLNAKLLRYLAQHHPEQARSLLRHRSSLEDGTSQVVALLQLGEQEQALEMAERLPLGKRWITLSRWSDGQAWDNFSPSDPTIFLQPARLAARHYLLEGGDPRATMDWLVGNDPELPDWLASRAEAIPPAARPVVADRLPREALRWAQEALEHGLPANAAAIWIEVAYCEEREALEDELRQLYSQLLAAWNTLDLTSLLRAAAGWNDFATLFQGPDQVRRAATSAAATTPEGLEWARELFASGRHEDRELACGAASRSWPAVHFLRPRRLQGGDGATLRPASSTATGSLRHESFARSGSSVLSRHQLPPWRSRQSPHHRRGDFSGRPPL